jgi:uncharacterized protein YlxP (DUF503 family)
MFVGVLRLTFHIPHARSLKDKRGAVRKFRDRVRARFDVSVAEVGAQDLLQRSVFGVSVVSADASVCDSVLTQVRRLANGQPEAALTGAKMEIIPMGSEFLDAGGDDFGAGGSFEASDDDDEI